MAQYSLGRHCCNISCNRFGPRQIRCESVLLRLVNSFSGVNPFAAMNVGDVGDVNINPYSASKTCQAITDFYREKILTKSRGVVPVAMGGDHLITYPILKVRLSSGVYAT